MASLILPKTYVQVNQPLIYLAGPIRSAPNWQDKAIEFLFSENPDLAIVSPRRGIRDNIASYVVSGKGDYFSRQRAWEMYYFDMALKDGVVMFWFPGEESHNCEKPYGAMTRFEIGKVLGEYKHDKSLSFCVGTGGSFSEFDIMLVDFKTDAPDKKIFPTLEATCLEALRLAK